MIGKVLFTMGGEPAEATLDDDGRWTVRTGDEETDKVLTDDLNIGDTCKDYSPADGQRGYLQLHRVAERFGGTVEAPEPGPGTPGVLY